MFAERTSPTSPKNGGFSTRITAFLSKTFEFSDEDADQRTLVDRKDRSASRGREYTSSGRGGLGNIRQASLSRDGRPDFRPEDHNAPRGRESVPAGDGSPRVYSTGRGGAGNLRSPSRDITQPGITEEKVREQYAAANKDSPHSTGRGGVGNIQRSRSRSVAPAVTPPVHSTGRGGAGNILPGDGSSSEALDEAERRKHVHSDAIHSTGRGGAANLTSVPGPAVEHHPHAHAHNEYASTGRGGVGNIHHA